MIEEIERCKEEVEDEKEKNKELKRNNNLINDFNSASEKLNLPYFMGYTGGNKNYVMLLKRNNYKFLVFKWKEDIVLKQMHYNKLMDNFRFCGDIDIKLFNEIEPILLECKSKFDIKIKGSDVPNKYKVMEELKK